MIQTRELSRVFHGVRPSFREWFKVLQGAAPQDEGSKSTSVEDRDRAWPEQHAEALDRLISRAEFELAHPEAVRRREIIARLKRAVASTEAEHTPQRALAIAPPASLVLISPALRRSLASCCWEGLSL